MELYNGNDKQHSLIEDIVRNLFDDDLLELNNIYCKKNGVEDNRIYEMCEIDNVLIAYTPTQILNACSDGFSINDVYFKISPYGVESNNNIHNLICADYDEFASFLLENGDVNNILDNENDNILNKFIEYTKEVILNNNDNIKLDLEDIETYITYNYYTDVYEDTWENLIQRVISDFKEDFYS